jgi:hypothetical protein
MKHLFCLIQAMHAAAMAMAAPVEFQSSERQTALVELFTSEGCNSCPPAESWLSRLKDAPGLWTDFVPLAFHVDYWDYLGWRDKWAEGQFSARQRAYAEGWHSDSIYTPGLVLNGREWRDWSGGTTVPAHGRTKAGVLKVTSADTNEWQASFTPLKPEAVSYKVNAALLLSGQASDVKAGENAGRHLQHDFVVVTLLERPLTRQEESFHGVFTISTKLKAMSGPQALAVWITRTGQMEPVQAAGGWIRGPNRN